MDISYEQLKIKNLEDEKASLSRALNQADVIEKKLLGEIEQLNQHKTRRGARMQIMHEWLEKYMELEDVPEGVAVHADDYREMLAWFDDDGVPL